MATTIGALVIWFLGNPDLIKLFAAFAAGIGVLHALLTIWHEARRNNEL